MFECLVTGTGTEVGKTIVAAGIASLCVDAGLRVLAVKPVQTGTESYDSDMDALASLVPEMGKPPHRVETILSFAYPASPHLAAEMEGAEIESEKLLDDLQRLRGDTGHDALVVEGAGGVMVPITRDTLYLDLMRRLGIPSIVVADAGLGTINHTLLTVEALRRADVGTAGIVLNMASGDPGPIEEDNAKIIEEISGVPVLAAIRDIRGNDGRVDPDSLRAEFAEQPLLAGLVGGNAE